MSIQLIDTTTLRMKVFVGDIIPKYAILSHTWVEDEEVDFREMTALVDNRRHLARRKSGYEKIRRTCEKARRHGLRYAWVDTCCIDKSSSAELSEAINSMFKWYRDAEICYVYLSDLPPSLAGYQDIRTAMEHCRWFGRSWALQELIAPEDLRFYNAAWDFVGTKPELQSTLSAITGIDSNILIDCSLLSEISVARKMSWASHREATRSEDVAYSLLGIFDVNMPLLYGEGRKAFIRLQEQIVGRSNDLSIFWNFTTSENMSREPTQSLEAAELRITTIEKRFIPDLPHRSSQRESSQTLTLGRPSNLPFRDLLAPSPRCFSGCGNVASSMGGAGRARISDRVALTNSGARFEDITFVIVRSLGGDRRCFYALRLGHNLGPMDYGSLQRSFPFYMILEKIGPAFFVRRELMWHEYEICDDMDHKDTLWEREYAYVVTEVPRLIEEQWRESQLHAIRVEVISNIKDERIILHDPAPWQVWDRAQKQFLTFGGCFRGHVMVRVRNPHGASSEPENECEFYLACEFMRYLNEDWQDSAKLLVKLLDPKEVYKHRTRPNSGDRVRDVLGDSTDYSWSNRDRLALNGVLINAEAEILGYADEATCRIRVELRPKLDEQFKVSEGRYRIGNHALRTPPLSYE